MTTRGVDYSWGRPGGAALAAEGFKFAIRYVDYPGAAGKGLTRAEADDLHVHSIAIGLVFESTAERPLEGYSAGRYDAQLCIIAGEALGFPSDRPFYFAIDWDPQINQFAAIDAYFAGTRDVLGLSRVGAYGGLYPLQHLQTTHRATWFWQALAWSGGHSLPGRHLYQYLNGQTVNGVPVDYNYAYPEDYGQWPKPEEDKMTPDQLARMERLERIVAANGIRVDGQIVTGEAALAYLDGQGTSAYLAIDNQNAALNAHTSPHPIAGYTEEEIERIALNAVSDATGKDV